MMVIMKCYFILFLSVQGRYRKWGITQYCDTPTHIARYSSFNVVVMVKEKLEARPAYMLHLTITCNLSLILMKIPFLPKHNYNVLFLYVHHPPWSAPCSFHMLHANILFP